MPVQVNDSGLADQIIAFLSSGGQVKTAPYGNAVNDNDGESWAQQSQRRWAARQDKESQK